MPARKTKKTKTKAKPIPVIELDEQTKEEFLSINEMMKNRGIHFGRSWGEKGSGSGSDAGILNLVQSDRMTFLFTGIVFLINLFLILPILNLNVSSAFSASSLSAAATWFESVSHLNKDMALLFITFLALAYAPISFYFFVRKLAFKNELTAFLATILFILPNPFFRHGLPLIDAVLAGDGAHAVVFSFLPLLFVSVLNYISNGKVVYGVMSAFFAASVAVVSPFASINFFLLLGLITIAEALNGNFRAKLSRGLFLLVSTVALSSFWLIPIILADQNFITQLSFVLKQLLQTAPIALPAIPIFGILSYLILNKRAYMRSIFLCGALFIAYLGLFSISRDINSAGIFTPSRYFTELSFGASLLLAGIFTLPLEKFLKKYVYNQKGGSQFWVMISALGLTVLFLLAITLLHIHSVQQDIFKLPLFNQTEVGLRLTPTIYPKYNSITASISIGTGLGLLALALIQSIKPLLLRKQSKNS